MTRLELRMLGWWVVCLPGTDYAAIGDFIRALERGQYRRGDG